MIVLPGLSLGEPLRWTLEFCFGWKGEVLVSHQINTIHEKLHPSKPNDLIRCLVVRKFRILICKSFDYCTEYGLSDFR